MADELTKALLFEEAAPPAKIAEALFASVMGSVPLIQALIDSHALSLEALSRYLARSGAPFLAHVVPVVELAERLPPGLCARLLAIPVRVDAITGTVDVAMANPMDPHTAQEIAFHVGAPVRAIRAQVAEIEEALRHVRMSAHVHSASVGGGAAGARADHERARSHAPATLAPRARAPEQSAPPRRGGLILDTDSAHPPADAPRRIRTPPWGTHVQKIRDHKAGTEPPESGYGSEIPIPLTRKGTPTDRSPPPPASLGEGYALDTTGLRAAVEKTASLGGTAGQPVGAFIPAPPPVPTFVGPQPPFAEMHGVLSALRNAASRNEVLELVLMGAAVVAPKVALLIVKKGGYLGWGATPELADRVALQSVLIPLDANSLFDRVVREELYLGPIPHDEVHAPLLRVLRSACRDVAAVPIRVSGKTAVIIVADDLSDTMIGTRRLEELARAAGEAFARIVRTRR